MARWQRRPYANLKDQPAAYRELVIQVTLSAVTLKAEHTWTEGAFEGLMTHTFTTWNHNLSSDDFKKASDLLPRNYRAALTLLSEEKSCIWNNQIHYQMCIHCKFVYRGDNRDDKVCQCGHARIPENLCKLVYMPISGHMRSAYGVKAAAKSMGSWWVRRNANPTQIRDSTDVINPYNYDPTKDIGFDNDPRHWMLTHIQDPFAPYKDDMSYSCSPSLVHVLNLPAWVRQKLGYAHLLSIGPGVRKRALKELANKVKKSDCHQHAIFADELNFLDKFGIEVVDASDGKPFQCRARLVNTVSDLRGMEKLVGISSTPARYGCLHCWWEGFRVGGKTLYCGHQTLLEQNDPLRRYLRDRNPEPITKADIARKDKTEFNRKSEKKSVSKEPCHRRCHGELVVCSPAPWKTKPLIEGEDSVVQLGEQNHQF